MRGTRNPNATLCHSERNEESRGEKNEILRFALNDKVGENYELQITNYERPLCHSEHSEESRGEEGRDSSLFF